MQALIRSSRLQADPRPRRRRRNGELPDLIVKGGQEAPPKFRTVVPPRVPRALIFARVIAWFMASVRFAIAVSLDRFRGQTSMARQAFRARQIIESMGGTAIVAGQQIAMRLDVLPLEYATELSRMSDREPPIPLSYAIERTEAATRGALSDVFETFDPEPIASTLMACVYQAVLRSGEKVAVKIRRPDAGLRLATERLAFDWILRWLTPFMSMQAGFFKHIRDELPQLLLENLDFTRAARLQRIFRRQARRNGLKRLSAAKVFIKLCGDDVMISEFVAGVLLSEVIAAQENKDPKALAKLASMGINPATVGRRLLHTCWWGFFENLFFCELPDPSQIVIRPKGRIVFVNLGDTSVMGWHERKLLMTGFERLCVHDVEGAVSMFVQLFLPLPHIDVHEFSKRIESRIWTQLFAMENRDCPWWERASTALWLAILQTTREYGVTVRLNIARMIQSACAYDHTAARLWPRIRVLNEFRRYTREATKRGARRVLRARRKARRKGENAGMAMQLTHVERLMKQLNLWTQSIVETVPVQYMSLAKKGAYTTSQTVLAIMSLAKLAVVAVALRMVYLWYRSESVDVLAAVQWVVTSPVFLVVLLLLFLATARRIMFRLDDIDALD